MSGKKKKGKMTDEELGKNRREAQKKWREEHNAKARAQNDKWRKKNVQLKKFYCEACDKAFSANNVLQRHFESKNHIEKIANEPEEKKSVKSNPDPLKEEMSDHEEDEVKEEKKEEKKESKRVAPSTKRGVILQLIEKKSDGSLVSIAHGPNREEIEKLKLRLVAERLIDSDEELKVLLQKKSKGFNAIWIQEDEIPIPRAVMKKEKS